jgi:uncharacterized protein YggE
MKQLSIILNTILVCVLVFILVITGLPNTSVQATQVVASANVASANAASTQEPALACDSSRSIHVSGTAVVNVTPDRVLIQLGIQSNGKTPNQVEAINSSTINQIIRALGKQGVQEKDVVTDYYVIQPIYDSYDSLYIKGYRINNVVAVTLRDISKVNDIITAALGAGANQVINVEFYLSDLRTYRDQARELAMVAAQEKAQDLATAAGSDAGCVLSINENTWSYYNGWWYGRDSNNLWTQNTVQNVDPSGGVAGQSGDGPVNLGQISVRAEVSASFALK